jgi:2-polyprenyl-3-methyl-5-hydroxy-6-metoxy-1,4-benzoquinol methylase
LVCPICHRIETKIEFPRPEGPALKYPLVRCIHCGLVFQERRPSQADLEEAQRTAYGRPGHRFNWWIETGIRLFRTARVRLATRLVPPGGRILDVGCGRGLFLHMLKQRGYEVQGTELSPAMAGHAYPGVPIDVGELEPGRYPDASFDLIALSHVLEHLRSPDVTLEACRCALKPGGVLLVSVPNYGSIQARLGREFWFHLDLPRHLFHFTGETLQNLLIQQGFRIEQLRTGQWEMDPFGLLQTVLNRTGLRQNALYDTLRNHEEVKCDLSIAYRAAMHAIFPLGMILALPLSLLFRLMKRAGTLLAVARKPAT